MVRKIPGMKTDAEVEAFLDFSQFKPIRFELAGKDARVNMRLPQGQLDAVKTEARKRGIPYQRLIRELIDRGLETLR